MTEVNLESKEQPIDNILRLEEMSEAMKQSINNAIKVYGEQQCLIDIVKSSDQSERFKDLIKTLSEQCDDLNAQVNTLTIRANLLDEIVEKCRESESDKELVNKVLKSLGVFEK